MLCLRRWGWSDFLGGYGWWDVQVTIDGIVLYCDETISALQLGNGYSIKKEYLEEINFKNKIKDGDGKLTISYMGSQLHDNRG